MDKTWYLERLKRRLEPYYDLEENGEYDGYHCELYARFFSRTERYIAVKKAVIFSVEKNQHIFVRYEPEIDEQVVKNMIAHLEKMMKRKVQPDEDHMSTFIRGILITDGAIKPAAAELARKYKGEKSFFFGIQGWVYNGINLVDLNDPSKHIHNRRGKEDRQFFSIDE